MFSVRAFIVLLLYAITLRDILLVRMGMFSSRFILDILRNTLYTIKGFLFRSKRNKQSPSMLNLGLRGNRKSSEPSETSGVACPSNALIK